MDPTPETSPHEQQGDPAGVSPEDARRFFEQLRATPVEQILTEVFTTLLTAAEVKLGRADARVLIDLCAEVLRAADGRVPAELVKQVEAALGQLRLAQVSAENQPAPGGEAEDAAEDAAEDKAEDAAEDEAEASPKGG